MKTNLGRVQGLDAYELAVKYNGFKGSVFDWLESLKGTVEFGNLNDKELTALVNELLSHPEVQEVLMNKASNDDYGTIIGNDDIDINDGNPLTHFIVDESEKGTIATSKKTLDSTGTITYIEGESKQNVVERNGNIFYGYKDLSKWVNINSNSIYNTKYIEDTAMTRFILPTVSSLSALYTPLYIPANKQLYFRARAMIKSCVLPEVGIPTDPIVQMSIHYYDRIPSIDGDGNLDTTGIIKTDIVNVIYDDSIYNIRSTIPAIDSNVIYVVVEFTIKNFTVDDIVLEVGKFHMSDVNTDLDVYISPTIPSPTPLNPAKFMSIGEVESESINLLNHKYDDFNKWIKNDEGNYASIYYIDNMRKFEVRNLSREESAYVHLRVNKSSIYTFSYIYTNHDPYDIIDGRMANCIQIFDSNPYDVVNVDGKDTYRLFERTVGKNGLLGIDMMSANECVSVKNSVTFATTTPDIYIVFNFSGMVDNDIFTFSLGKFQLEYGSRETSYTPYNLYEVDVCGLDICSTNYNVANLCDDEYYRASGTGIKVLKQDNRDWTEVPTYTKLKANTNYNIMVLSDNLLDYEFGLFDNLTDEEPAYTFTKSLIDAPIPNRYSFTTMKEYILKGKFWVSEIESNTNYDCQIMVVEDDFIEDIYSAYLGNNIHINDLYLSKLSDEVYDYYSYDEKAIVRNIKNVVLDGEENKVLYIAHETNDDSTVFGYSNVDMKIGGFCASDIALYGDIWNTDGSDTVYGINPNRCIISSTEQTMLFTIENTILGIDNSDSKEIKEAKCNEWLNVNPIRIYYELNSPEKILVEDSLEIKSYDKYTSVFMNNTLYNPIFSIRFNSKGLGTTNLINRILHLDIKKLLDLINTNKTNEFATKEDIEKLFTSTRAAQISSIDGRYIVTSSGKPIVTGYSLFNSDSDGGDIGE